MTKGRIEGCYRGFQKFGAKHVVRIAWLLFGRTHYYDFRLLRHYLSGGTEN